MQRDHVWTWPRQTAACEGRGSLNASNVPPGLTAPAGARASIHIARMDCLRRSIIGATAQEIPAKMLIAGIMSGSSKAVAPSHWHAAGTGLELSLRRLEAAENRVGGLVLAECQIYDWTYPRTRPRASNKSFVRQTTGPSSKNYEYHNVLLKLRRGLLDSFAFVGGGNSARQPYRKG